jgi:hypothetical protein
MAGYGLAEQPPAFDSGVEAAAGATAIPGFDVADPGQVPPAQPAPGQSPLDQYGQPVGGPTIGLPPTAVRESVAATPRRRSLIPWIVLGLVAIALAGAALWWFFGRTEEAVGAGSLSEPHALTDAVLVTYNGDDRLDRWEVVIVDPVRDAGGEAAEAVGAGETVAAAGIRVANDGSAETSLNPLSFELVTSSGTAVGRAVGSCEVDRPALDPSTGLDPGGATEGSLCWVVPATAIDDLVLRIGHENASESVHIALR